MSDFKEIRWLEVARALIGTRELPGTATNILISGWLKKLGAWWSDDAAAWCGVFTAHCMQEAGYAYPKAWYRAKAWLDWGETLPMPMYGCIVVFTRTGGGHVGFCVGKDSSGRLLVLGGNQGDKVSIAPFDMSRVAGYRFPSRYPFTMRPLPVIDSNAATSSNEA